MANPEQLEILKQGVEVWNRWRYEHPEICPDLSGASLSGAHLSRADLSSAHLSRADLNGADLSSADLCRADLNGTALGGATLIGAYMRGVNLRGADLSGADLRLVNLNGANLGNAHLIHTDLSGANLSDAEIISANLRRSTLKSTTLERANLNCAHLDMVDLSMANLKNVDLSHAYLLEANLSGANLSGASFHHSIMSKTIFADIDLREAERLETVDHWGPSEISVSTIYISDGNIPEIFLRGCGVPENFITYMRSLTGQALEFYKCFISFTEADDLFSERLYNDLQGAGVRCWRWKEDAKWGETLMRSIDEAVRLYDKLIVICSEQSLKSPAVIREIERALQKEDEIARQGKWAEVLFPIRLDDYIFTGWSHHRKVDVTAKNVGDFRLWNEPEKYKKAFDRLLRDLKAEDKKP
jgi:uncharacterized protein YjbI with pentapeptide repeats